MAKENPRRSRTIWVLSLEVEWGGRVLHAVHALHSLVKSAVLGESISNLSR
jgi:hypothetical protein